MEKVKIIMIGGDEVKISVTDLLTFCNSYRVSVTGKGYYQSYMCFEGNLEADLIKIEEITKNALERSNVTSILEKLGYI